MGKKKGQGSTSDRIKGHSGGKAVEIEAEHFVLRYIDLGFGETGSYY